MKKENPVGSLGWGAVQPWERLNPPSNIFRGLGQIRHEVPPPPRTPEVRGGRVWGGGVQGGGYGGGLRKGRGGLRKGRFGGPHTRQCTHKAVCGHGYGCVGGGYGGGRLRAHYRVGVGWVP